MRRLNVLSVSILLAGAALAAPAHAQSVAQQCGQQYQAAKAANGLNGMTWPAFRADCAARLKAAPASAGTAAAPEPAPAPVVAANPLKPVPAAAPAPAGAPPVSAAPAGPPAAAKPATSGRLAFVARERQCGSEWKANKVSLVAQTPGLTWPKYLSQCNTRLKAAGQ